MKMHFTDRDNRLFTFSRMCFDVTLAIIVEITMYKLAGSDAESVSMLVTIP